MCFASSTHPTLRRRFSVLRDSYSMLHRDFFFLLCFFSGDFLFICWTKSLNIWNGDETEVLLERCSWLRARSPSWLKARGMLLVCKPIAGTTFPGGLECRGGREVTFSSENCLFGSQVDFYSSFQHFSVASNVPIQSRCTLSHPLRQPHLAWWL